MKKTRNIVGLICTSFIIIRCQGSQETADMSEEPMNEETSGDTGLGTEADASEDGESDANDQDGDEEENTSDEPEYEEEVVHGSYVVTNEQFILHDREVPLLVYQNAFTFMRTEEDKSLEERLIQSLQESDVSEQNILSDYTTIDVDWPRLTFHFKEGNETHFEGDGFNEAIVNVSAMYGIEEIDYFDEEGKQFMVIGYDHIEETVFVEEERLLTRGYYIVYDEDLEETLFVSGQELLEPVKNEAEEPFSFEETIEAMHTIDGETDFATSVIYDEIDIIDTRFEDGNAIVHYSLDEETITEEEQIVFERAMQLTALDFHADELHLINETKKTKSVYPLLIER